MLRPWHLGDAPDLQRLVSAKEIADGIASIPHPYPDGGAADWIASAVDAAHLRLAMVRRADGALVGGIGLRVEREHDRAEVGYFVGVEHWGRGYATEALRAALAHGFDELALNRVYAHHFVRNAASGRVLEKAGFRREGIRRRHTRVRGEYLDSAAYGILRSEYDAAAS
ncbi:MAG: GNAT family N-acetyltransferase [Actinomycetota bacterium]|nr:GNAT family N-acetyltransferase [Actinomycetota bacterium]